MSNTIFLTSGDIATRLDEEAMKIRHIIATRRIKHIGRAGTVRLFPESAVGEVRDALATITRRRRRKTATV